MANFLNKIQIARGNFANKKTLAYGELFYDRSSRNILIGAKEKDSEEVVTKRVGGADGLVLKGTIDGGQLPSGVLPELIAGDTYFLSAPIFFTKASTGACEQVTPDPKDPQAEKSLIKWEKDSIIVYLGPDSGIANSEVIYNNWLYVNSSFLKADHVKFDTDRIESLNIDKATLDNVQTALEYLFHTNMAYAGKFGENNVPLADPINLVNGSFAYFAGETGNVTVHSPKGDETLNDVKENSLIIRQNDQNYVIPLGAADASGIAFTFTQTADYNDSVDYGKHSINADGSEAILNHEEDIDTVTKAIDWLNGKKADLKADGKIPLEQIPSTLIGALQFKGTVEIETLIGAEPGLGKDHITAEELVNYIKTNLHYDSIDEGDYVIFTKKGDTDATVYVDGTAYNSGDWAIYLPRNPEPEIMTDADHWERINASAAVDNVNGCIASVKIEATEGIDVNTNQGANTITISNGYLLSDAANVPTDHVPIKAEDAGEHAVKDSHLAITRKADEEGLTLTDTEKSIDLSMKANGDILTAPKGVQGTLDKLPKFNAEGQLVDSVVTNNSDNVKIGDKSSVTVKTGNGLGLDVHLEKGVDDHFKFEEALTKDAKENVVDIDHPATLLTDASVIDCGEW